MAAKLPDELLREILAPQLRVADELFADAGQVSPFSRTEYSASVVLQVCKRWMRVCTPWLYETVVIRSEAQAQALAGALTRNPQFGKYIRKLRIEGAYGRFLPTVVDVATNVTDLCFTLTLWSSFDVAGLVKGLRTFNPRRVIITLHQQVTNMKQDLVLETLCARIPEWTNLTTFVFPSYKTDYGRRIKDDNGPCIADAIAQREELTTVHFPSEYITEEGIFPTVRCLSPYVNVASILIPGLRRLDNGGRWRSRLPKDLQAVMQDLEHVPLRPSRAQNFNPLLALPNPFFIPLHGAPAEVRRAIWTRVFSFACILATDSLFDAVPVSSAQCTWLDTRRYNRTTSTSLLGVSQDFKYAALPILCKYCRTMYPEQGRSLVATLRENPSIGSKMKTLSTSDGVWLREMLPSTTNLRQLRLTLDQRLSTADERIEPSSLLDVIAHSLGHCLEELKIEGCSAKLSSACPVKIFGKFTRLRRLHWLCHYVRLTATTRVISLPNLVYLCTGHDIPPAFLDLSLPSLETLVCKAWSAANASLFEKHGSHVQHVAVGITHGLQLLPLVPSLQSIEMNAQEPDSRVFWKNSHTKLCRIHVHWETTSPYTKRESSEWPNFFLSLTAEAYPALREVKVEKLTWPASERDISKSKWPGYAESLARHGIGLVDKDGRGWRTRLRVA
ncbi:hypothetical protein EXIGLDRAFT_841322 [Exidia glandulosa HHB12029]|uniref:Uncharacterized protein n=1 Tax=Exidia glandulosa HHB12029 TaxID=1314781 RepID=A0A165DY49_EXIGL|nr:hypothetical protein EXIGLDRAFT_841322 [Exidia glandulosa HHB12029]